MQSDKKYVVMNASTQPVQAQYDGAMYFFRPGETKELSNFYTARHLVDRWKNYGMVALDFDDKAKNKYGSFVRYCLEKEKEGLDLAILGVENTITGFDSYDNECGDKKTVVRNQMKRKKAEWEKIHKSMSEYRVKLNSVNIEEREKLSLQDEIKKAEQAAEEAKQRLSRLSGNNTSKSAGRVSDRDARS